MEDDPGIARLLQKTLQRRGFVVDIALNGEDGLAMIDATQYDLLLIDYNMPFLGGIDVIRTLAAKKTLPPTIMVTGEGNELVAVEALKLGAADYLVKDVDMKYLDLLPSVIDQILYKQQLIRERQHMVEAVKASEERYRLLFDNNPIPSMVYDLQTLRFMAVNDAAVLHYGYTREEFLFLTINDIYTGEEMPALLKVLSKLDKGEKQTGVWKHRLKSGSVIDVEITSHCLTLNEIRAHVILANDITERKKLEEDLMRAQKLESLGVLAGGLAHDFNNFLTAILGNIYLAKLDAPPKSAMARHLDEAERAGSRAQNVTQQLLTFSRGGAPLKKPVHMRQLIEESAGFALHGSKVKCEFRISRDLWTVEADESQIGQVIHNLVINADQAMPSGGTVTITAENIALTGAPHPTLRSGNHIKIAVSDQGTGIAEQYRERIFDPYFTTKHKGSGLGLATCYSIIKRHDGHMTVESVPGQGATFSIYLPALSHDAPTERAGDQQLLTGTGRVLVMDDEEMVRDVASKILTNLGFTVSCALDGREAIEMYRQALKTDKPFDVVIMDLTIPGGMGGKEALEKLLQLDPGVKAIVSSGYSNDPIMSRYKQHGFRGVVTKPYSVRTLSETVLNIIGAEPDAV
jgi:PAS domain S-box-containing protein